ncbi:hypothetical protein LINPERHAP1_LOCUS28709 [Linum perenne]
MAGAGSGSAGSKMMAFLLLAFLLFHCMSGSRDDIKVTVEQHGSSSVAPYHDDHSTHKRSAAPINPVGLHENKKEKPKTKKKCSKNGECSGICPVKCIKNKCTCSPPLRY